MTMTMINGRQVEAAQDCISEPSQIPFRSGATSPRCQSLSASTSSFYNFYDCHHVQVQETNFAELSGDKLTVEQELLVPRGAGNVQGGIDLDGFHLDVDVDA